MLQLRKSLHRLPQSHRLFLQLHLPNLRKRRADL
jgi:hypothetical protein